jgi:hypothetical protein
VVSIFNMAHQNKETELVSSDPESLVRGLYASVSFEADTTPDWDYVRSFFIPEAVFGVRKTRTSMEVLGLDGFVAWWLEDIEKHKMKERGFEESVENLKMTEYGNIAQCFVVYKARFKTPADAPGQLGLDSFALMKKDGRWWIVSIMNDVVTPQNPLPEDLRK